MDFIDPLGILSTLGPATNGAAPGASTEGTGVREGASEKTSMASTLRRPVVEAGSMHHSPCSAASSTSSFSPPRDQSFDYQEPLDLIEDAFDFYDGSVPEALSPSQGTEEEGRMTTTAAGFLYDCSILGIPESGARSRTETQVKMIVRIVPKSVRVPLIKWLSLPAHQLSNNSRRSSKAGIAGSVDDLLAGGGGLLDEDTLQIRARIMRSGNEEALHACFSCILRERRRCLKKRLKVERGSPEGGGQVMGRSRGLEEGAEEEDDEMIGGGEEDDEGRRRTILLMRGGGERGPNETEVLNREMDIDRERIILFASNNRRVQLLRGDCPLPIRITCYCRHHEESSGFRVRLEFLDRHHRLVGTAVSPPILITDDHKRASRQACQAVVPDEAPFGIPLCPIAVRAPSGLALSSSSTLSPPLPLSSVPASPPSGGPGGPKALKVVPAEGPMYGGIEVTVLGEGLQAHDLLLFGSLPAPIVNFISPCTVVVRLPPSQMAGLVPITVAGQDFGRTHPNEVVFFNYKNDLDRAMMELALQLIGMKMTGRVDDARDIALRIINEFSPAPISTPLPGHAQPRGPAEQAAERLERVLITCFAAAEVTGGLCFTEGEVASVRTCGGQTLLHLAALTRCDHLFEYLSGIGDGLLLATVDRNGFTPADLSYFAGRDDFLEGLGLDDNEADDRYCNLDLASRYRFIRERAMGRLRGLSGSVWSALTEHVNRICRNPSRIRNHFNRLRHSAWRRVSSDASIKKYYLSSFGLDGFTLDAGTRLYQDYQESKPLKARSRDLLFLYFWIPVVLATLMVWYFDFGANVMSVVASSWQGEAPLPVA